MYFSAFYKVAQLFEPLLHCTVWDPRLAAAAHRACLRGVLASGSHWCQARLVEADFRASLDQLTDLGWADLRGADLSFAQFQGANLRRANLRGAALYGTNFREADLRGADLRGVDLRDCQWRDASLNGALLEGARLPDGMVCAAE